MKKLIIKSMSGMSYGLFATLIIGVIIGQFGTLVSFDFLSTTLPDILKACLGIGVALGVGISIGFTGLKLVTLTTTGAIASGLGINIFTTYGINAFISNEPLTIYIVVMITAVILHFWKKSTPVDIILIPLIGVATGTIATYLLSGPIMWGIVQISSFVSWSSTQQPLIMGIIISVIMGILLTSPISSVAVALAINLGASPLAAGAAVLGCSVQMLGFAVMSRKDNSIGEVISVGIGTSMFQFKNIVKKPIIWLPTIIASAVLAPLSTSVFKISSTTYGAGMGTSGLVGQLQSFDAMGGFTWTNVGIILLVQIVLPIILVFGIDLLFRHLGWIKPGDLRIAEPKENEKKEEVLPQK